MKKSTFQIKRDHRDETIDRYLSTIQKLRSYIKDLEDQLREYKAQTEYLKKGLTQEQFE